MGSDRDCSRLTDNTKLFRAGVGFEGNRCSQREPGLVSALSNALNPNILLFDLFLLLSGKRKIAHSLRQAGPDFIKYA
jgi:hypothetical protein